MLVKQLDKLKKIALEIKNKNRVSTSHCSFHQEDQVTPCSGWFEHDLKLVTFGHARQLIQICGAVEYSEI